MIDVGLIQEMLDRLVQLQDAIRRALLIEDIRETQERFSLSVERAMQAFRAGHIQVDLRALPEVMYHWAVNELPVQVQNNSNFPKILQQLELFKNIINNLLHPLEIS